MALLPTLHCGYSYYTYVITLPTGRVQSTVIDIYMSVCLFACISHKPYVQTSKNLLWLGLGPSQMVKQDVMYFRFVADIIFSQRAKCRLGVCDTENYFNVTHQVAPLNCTPGSSLLSQNASLSTLLVYYFVRFCGVRSTFFSTTRRDLLGRTSPNQKAPQGGCGHRRQHARLR